MSKPEGAIFHIYDPDGILCVYNQGECTTVPFYAGKKAWVGLYRPTSTTCVPGHTKRPAYDNGTYRRYYYHELKDGTEIINIPGIPCQEKVTWAPETPWLIKWYNKQNDVPTALHHADKIGDGEWNGGIAVKDRLLKPWLLGNVNIFGNQEVRVDGILVSKYIIYMKTGATIEEPLWKVPK